MVCESSDKRGLIWLLGEPLSAREKVGELLEFWVRRYPCRTPVSEFSPVACSMSSAPPSELFLLPLESGTADTRLGDSLSTESSIRSLLQEAGSQRAVRPATGGSLSGKPPLWFVGDEANSLLRVLSDLTQLDFVDGPVVLYGPPQTGKSVLADALAKRWARNRFFRLRVTSHSVPADNLADNQYPEAGRLVPSKAVCLSAFDWSQQLQEALDTNSLPAFHQRFLQAGAVMIDDLQQLHNSPFAQGQLLLLIDRLEVADIPLVFTLNQPPQAVAGLRADLVSRLLGGLLLPVSLPGQTAREKLALDWAQEARLNLSSAAWEWLLNLPQTKSYPGLMGTLRKLQVHFPGQSREYWEPADLQAVLCLPTTEANLTWPQLIIETVAQHFDLPAELLYGSSRRQTTVQARGLAMTLIRALCNCSLTELGQLFGNRDHSTVLNAVDATRKRFHTDRHFEVTANRLLEKLEQIASLQRLPFSRHSLPEWLQCSHDRMRD